MASVKRGAVDTSAAPTKKLKAGGGVFPNWKSYTIKASKPNLLVRFPAGWSLPTCKPAEPLKIAGFDLNGTLEVTKSGSKPYLRTSPNDWKFLNENVAPKLIDLATTGYTTIIITNQNGIKAAHEGKAAAKFQQMVELILNELQVEANKSPEGQKAWKAPVLVAATQKDDLRKGAGNALWKWALGNVFNCDESGIDWQASFFVGDAAGRGGDDFSDSDLQFAKHCGLTFYNEQEYFK